ncbi:MAG: insulinase family protein [Oscillospiraceae bacterium]|nr:insulinase family protein [Oscillospiraceae bacterium]
MINTVDINGNITLSYIPMKKLKTTSVGVYLHRPLTRDEAAKNALLAYVLHRGCAEYPTTRAMAEKLEDLYGASLSSGVSKVGETQILSVTASSISDRYAPDGEPLISELTSLLLSTLFEPLTEDGIFKKIYVEQEKQTLKDNIESVINDKRAYAQLRCAEIMCPEEAYGIRKSGYPEDVDKISAEELYNHYRSIILSSKTDIFVAGDADINALCKDIKGYISNYDFTPCRYPSTVIKPQSGNVKNVTESLDVTQGKLSVGFRTGITPESEKYPGLVVANSVFGSGAHCKLFNTVREKMSLAYYASSQLDKAKGVMFVNAGIEFDNFDKAYNEIIRQLELVKNGTITDTELTAAKNAVINSLNSYYDNEGHIIVYYLTERLLGTNNDIESLKERIRNVTTDDITEAAKEIALDTVYFLKGKE